MYYSLSYNFLQNLVGWAPHAYFNVIRESESPSQRSQITHASSIQDELPLQMEQMESGTRYI